MIPEGFPGPTVVVAGEITEDRLQYAGGLMLKYAGNDNPTAIIRKESNGISEPMTVRPIGIQATVSTL